MQLIYRGYTIDYTPRPTQPYSRPRALNWRWHSPDETFESTPRPVHSYSRPRALNWRFDIQSGI